MSISPTQSFFGELPTEIIMQTSGDFDGVSAQSSPAVLTVGVATFPEQAGGGNYNLHTRPISVLSVEFVGDGSLTVSKVSNGKTILLATLNTATPRLAGPLPLSPGDSLSCISSGGGTQLSILAQEYNTNSLG